MRLQRDFRPHAAGGSGDDGAIHGRLWQQQAREPHAHRTTEQGDGEIGHRELELVDGRQRGQRAGRRIEVHHRHDDGDQHQHGATDAEDDGAGIDEQFDRHQRHAHDEDHHPFRAGQASHEATDEIDQNRRDADDAGDAEARRLHLDVDADHPDDEQDRADAVDPRAELLHARWFHVHSLRARVAEDLNQLVDILHRAG